MSSTLTLIDVLKLVGPVDDTAGEHSARERFRTYLQDSVTEAGVLRDYTEICINTSGLQYARAFQDLVNHCGRLLGFTVEFGRYQGSHTEIGHDGLWQSSTGLCLVVEVKTTDAFTIQTSTLLGYIDKLIEQKKIADRDHALGLYVVGRLDASLNQLKDAIVAQKLMHQLRIASVDTLLSLVELTDVADLAHDEVIGLLRPGSPVVDETIKVLTRVAALPPAVLADSKTAPVEPPAGPDVTGPVDSDSHICLITPVSDDEQSTAEEVIHTLLDHGWYVFGDKTPGRKKLKPGDQLCFYRTGTGVVAKATVASIPEKRLIKGVRDPERFPWAFRVNKVRYFDKPQVIDASLRSRLEAFKGRDPNHPWAWFVQATLVVTQHDFDVLVGVN
jgi:hypothetical protein